MSRRKDSQEVVALIDENDKDLKLYSGYVGDYKAIIEEMFPKIKVHVCVSAYRNTPLSEDDKQSNRAIARTRARIEHIFGYMTRFMAGITSRVHGIDRVRRDITAKNLAYNLKRFVCIMG